MAEGMSRLVIDVEPGDSLAIGGEIRIDVQHKSGRAARLVIELPRDVRVDRKKVDAAREKPVVSMTDSVPSMVT